MINRGREWEFMDNDDNREIAVRNSYEVIINNKDAIELLGDEEGYFIHLPFEPVTKDVCDDMIEYFEEVEEYEKCNKLLKLKELVIMAGD